MINSQDFSFVGLNVAINALKTNNFKETVPKKKMDNDIKQNREKNRQVVLTVMNQPFERDYTQCISSKRQMDFTYIKWG